MRNKLIHSFGGIGIILWLILGFCLSYMPIWFLPIHGIAMVAVIAVIMFVPIVGDVLNFILWAVSFPTVLSGPQDGLAIAYYIIFAIYIISNVIPFLLGILPIIGSLGEIELIKPKYSDWDNTPLKFYKFHRAILPIGCALGIIYYIVWLFDLFVLSQYFRWWVLLFRSAIYLAILVLAVIANDGLHTRMWRGVRAYYVGVLLSLIDKVFVAIAASTGASITAVYIVGAVIAYAVLFIPVYIYYQKRRMLFSPVPAAVPHETYTQKEAQMKQFVVDESTGEVISETPVEDPKPVVLSYAPDFKLSGPPQPVQDEAPQEPAAPQEPSKKGRTLCILLAVLCAASLVGNAVQGYMGITQKSESLSKESEMQEQIDSLNKKITSLNAENNRINRKLSDALDDSGTRLEMLEMLAPEAFAMETYIGFIYDGSKYCHSYNCAQFPFEDCDEFTAHNVEYCEWLGYPKHASCWDQ